jgi:hypothetical protein
MGYFLLMNTGFSEHTYDPFFIWRASGAFFFCPFIKGGYCDVTLCILCYIAHKERGTGPSEDRTAEPRKATRCEDPEEASAPRAK